MTQLRNLNYIMHDIIGYLATFFSSISFLPQVLRIWKTRSAHDLSMITLVLLFSNTTLWCIYGVMIDAQPIWLTNSIVLAMIITMIYFKLRFKNEAAIVTR